MVQHKSKLGDEQLMVVHHYNIATPILLLLRAIDRPDRHVRGTKLVDIHEFR